MVAVFLHIVILGCKSFVKTRSHSVFGLCICDSSELSTFLSSCPPDLLDLFLTNLHLIKAGPLFMSVYLRCSERNKQWEKALHKIPQRYTDRTKFQLIAAKMDRNTFPKHRVMCMFLRGQLLQ